MMVHASAVSVLHVTVTRRHQRVPLVCSACCIALSCLLQTCHHTAVFEVPMGSLGHILSDVCMSLGRTTQQSSCTPAAPKLGSHGVSTAP